MPTRTFASIAKRSPLAIVLAMGLAAAPPAARAQEPDHDLEYVAEYGVMTGADDRVSSSGTKLSDPAAILQQDRYNVDVRGVLQPGDSADSYFGDKAHRAAIAKAAIEFTDEHARAHVVNGTYPLFVLVKRPKGGGRLTFFVSTSDGEPADDSAYEDADARDSTATPAPESSIPAAFHGRWATSLEACDTREPLATLTIDARGVHQAEGEMLAERVVRADDPARITVEARNSGGGEEWASTEEFTASADGQRIDWRQLKPDPEPARHLFRCGTN